jgi:hypothetical protein
MEPAIEIVMNMGREVLAGRRAQAVPDYVPILELVLKNGPMPTKEQSFSHARLVGQIGNVDVWIESPKPNDQSRMYRVFVDNGLSTGSYELTAALGNLSLVNLRLNHVQGNAIERRYLSAHRISIASEDRDTTKGSIVPIWVIQQRRVVSVLAVINGVDRCILEETQSADFVLNNPWKGWATFNVASFSDHAIELEKIRWQPGGSIEIDIPLEEMQGRPDKLILRHEESGYACQLDQWPDG